MVDRAPKADDVAMMNATALRLRTWWRQADLEERLAHGADPAHDPRLSLRAEQLCSRASRRRIAEALAIALNETRKTFSISARLPLRRSDVRACADDIVALAARLGDDRPIDPQGAAMASRLVFDGISPLYREGAVSLRYAVRSARLALDPLEEPVAFELSHAA